MSLQEFQEYVRNSGVDFETLSVAEKRDWRETFDKFKKGSSRLSIVEILSILPIL